jgi:hypothetical protein
MKALCIMAGFIALSASPATACPKAPAIGMPESEVQPACWGGARRVVRHLTGGTVETTYFFSFAIVKITDGKVSDVTIEDSPENEILKRFKR